MIKTSRHIKLLSFTLCLLGLVFWSLITNGQSKQGDNWAFGHHAGVSFKTGTPVSFTGSATNGNQNLEGTATISDSNGNLLFYTDGQTIWNKNHQTMETGLNGDYSSTQSGVIVPHPTSTDTYYVFTVDAANDALLYGLRYTIVDMSLNGGLGGVPTGAKNINITPSGAKMAEKITGVRHCNNVDIWVLAHGFSENTATQDYGEKFYAYQITPNGIITTPVESKVGTEHTGGDMRTGAYYYGNARGYMKVSPDGRKVALAITYDGCSAWSANSCSSTSGAFEVFDFDYTTGKLSNPIRLKNNYKGAYGVEFSPNGDLLYGSTWASYGGDNKIYQWDLTQTTQAAVQNSEKTIVDESTVYGRFGALQLASDGKIYAVRAYENYLSAIEYPNKKGTACGYKRSAASLGSGTGRYGLPTFIQSYFDPSLGFSYYGQYEDMITYFYIADSVRIDSVRWLFNDTASGSNSTSTQFSPSFKFSDTGSYAVQLIIWKCNIVDTIQHTIIIYPRPNTGFSLNDTAQCLNDNSFEFTNNTTIESGSVAYYHWEFGDGDTSNLTNPTHTYKHEGTYTIKLVATSNHNGKDSITQKVVVITSPYAGIGVFDSVQCIENNLFFIDNYSKIDNNSKLTYYWEFGDGDTSTMQFLSSPKTYASVDTFLVKLVVSSDSGCTDTALQSLITCPMPVAGFSVNDSIQCFNENLFSFTDSSDIQWGSINYFWDFGNSDTSTLQHPDYSYTTSDTFTVKLLTISDQGCRDSAYQTVYIDPSPQLSFTVNENPQCFAGHQFDITNASTIDFGSINWNWDFGDGNSSNTKEPSHSYALPDSYYIQLIATSDKNCQDTQSLKVDVYASPETDFSINDSIQCLNENYFTFTNSSSIYSGSMTYLWSFGNDSTSTQKDTNYIYSKADTFQVTLYITSDLNCKDSLTKTAIVHPSPALSVNMDKITLCAGTLVQINLSGADSFHWFTNTGIITSTTDSDTVIVSPPSTLTYQIEGENLYACTDTIQTTVNVFPLPNIDAGPNDTICYEESTQLNGSGGLTYEWTPGASLSDSTIANPIATPSKTTTYYLTIKNAVDELITNGNFSSGNTGFTSSYTYSSNLGPAGVYYIGNNPNSTNSSFPSCGDYNTGSGNMMIINGATTANQTIWEQTVNVTKNTEYAFSTYVSSLSISSPAKLIFLINGVQVSNEFSPGSTTCQWEQFYSLWDSDTNTTATISIVNNNITGSGNDFALDALSFAPLCSNTDSVTIIVNPKPIADFTINDSTQCFNGNQFIITNKTSIDSGKIDYVWQFGNGDTSIAEHPVYSYSTDDTFQIRLITTSDKLCGDTISKTVYVFPNPTASISVNDSQQCFAGNSFLFSNHSSINSGLTTYSWDLGDGNTSALKEPIHTYGYDDTFLVTMIATSDLNCQDSAKLNTYVFPTPKVDFSIDDSTQCLNGNHFNFTNFSSINTGSMTHQWDFGDLSSSTNKSAGHIYTTDDTFYVKLVTTSNLGCQDSLEKTVYVFPNPNTSFSVNDSQQCFANNIFNFTNNSTLNTGVQTYAWNFGDGNNSVSKDPVHSYTYDDTFRVSLISTSDLGCEDSANLTVYVFPSPVASFNINDTSQCLYNNNFIFYNTSLINKGSFTNNWDFGDATTSTVYSPSHSYTLDDTFVVKLLTTSNLGCKDSFYHNIYTHPMPVADFSISDSQQCLSVNSFTFSNLSTINSGTINHYWTFDYNSDTSTLKSPSYTYGTHDTYTVKLLTTSAFGCQDSMEKTVYVFPMPQADFSINDSGQCFKNNLFKFYDSSNISSGSIDYTWTFGDNTNSTLQNPAHTYSIYDTFEVKLLTSSDLGCKDSLIKSIQVYPMPVADFSINDSAQCLSGNLFNYTNNSNLAYGTISNAWYYGDGDTANILNGSHVYAYNDTFTVRLISSSEKACIDTSDKKIIVFPMPLADFLFNDSMQCLTGNQFSFTNTSYLFSGTMDYNWYLGDGSVSNDTDLNYTYASDDTFKVKLVVTSDQACTDSITKTAYVHPMPDAAYLLTDTSQCFERNAFGFVNLTTIKWGQVDYCWSFGDGDTSSIKNPVHSYAYPDTFVIKLVAKSEMGCMDSVSGIAYVHVHPEPVADFYAQDSAQCLFGNEFQFVDTSSISSGFITYQWDFGDAGNSTQQHPLHSYSYHDTIDVKLLVVSDWGCIDSIIKQVIVFPMPEADFLADDSSQCLSGNQYNFSDTTYIPWGSLNYKWDFDDGSTATGKYISHSYANHDTFKVMLVATSAMSCPDTAYKEIIVNPMPDARFTVDTMAQCVRGNLFSFFDSSTIYSGMLSYDWNFGDGFSSTMQHPTHSYASYDTFTVQFMVTSGLGCQDSSEMEVVTHPMPVSSYGINDSQQCLNENLFVFSNNSFIPYGYNYYQWIFDDGGVTYLANPSHHYLQDDTFEVKLVATSDLGCKDSIIHKAYVFPSPLPFFEINDNTQCFDSNSFGFTNKSTINSGSMTYLWDFGDGSSSTNIDPTHSYAIDDTFLVTLIATSKLGCADTVYRSASVYPSPETDFIINKEAQCWLDNNFTFTNTSKISTGTLTYYWKFEDGYKSSLYDVTHSFATYDTFDVKLISVSNLNCRDSVIKEVVVHPMPTAGFNINDSSQCLTGNEFLFTNTSSIPYGNLTYSWDFDDGNTETAKDPLHTYNTYDDYHVILIASSQHGCSDTIVKDAFVHPMPQADFSIDTNSQCLRGNEFNFTNESGIVSGSLSYKWLFGDGDSSISLNAKHKYFAQGSYNVKLIAISTYSCPDTSNEDISVRPMPKADFSINDTTQCLSGNQFIYTNTSTINSGSMTYFWDLGDGNTSTSTNATHAYATDSAFTVMLISTSDAYNCPDTIYQDVVVHPMPVADFTHYTPCLEDSIRFTDQSTVKSPDIVTGWNWKFGDGFTSLNQNPLHIYLNPGTYSVKLVSTSDKGCSDSITKNLVFFDHVDAPLLDRVTVVDNEYIKVEWEASTQGRPKEYILERSLDNLNFASMATLEPDTFEYWDLSADVMSKSYIYRMYVVDSCEYVSPYSNIGKSILLNVDEETLEYPETYWTKYKEWAPGIDRYELSVYNSNTRQDEIIGTLLPTDTNMVDDRTKINQANYCYTVTAFRTGDDRESKSNTVCAATPFNIQIPNAFTPNGDGLNDQLVIKGTHILTYDLKIYNRWGELMFETTDILDQWDGTYKGEPCPMGVYYIWIDARGTNFQKEKHKGSVTLLR